MNKKLIIILIIASALRLFLLGQHPVHLTNDEAALGYNAYSIFKTARDEHGAFMPLVFKSFGDWKPGLYVYLTVPSVAILGLNEFAVRLPSALAGVLAVFLLYKIVDLLYLDKRIALVSSLLLAVTPWHIHFSRGAWEANVALTLLLAALWCFIKSFSNNRYLYFSLIFFSLTLWTYQSAKLASLIVIVGLSIIFFKQIISKIPKKNLLTAIFIGLALSTPVIFSVFNGKGGRIEVMSVFSYKRSAEYINNTIYSQDNIDSPDLAYYLFHSEPYNLSRGVMGRYFNHLSGRFLFFEGDWQNPIHTSPDTGYLLYIEIPFLLYGLYFVIKNMDKKENKFILYWLLTSPIPSALTRDAVHGIRSLNMVIPLTVVAGIGVCCFFSKINNIFIKKVSIFMVAALLAVSLIIYLDAYFIHLPGRDSKNFLFGYKQIVVKTNELSSSYNEVIVQQSYGQPYIFFLFFNKIDPSEYQKNGNFIEGENGDVGHVLTLGNIVFRDIDWPKDKEKPGVLMIAHEDKFPLYEIYDNPKYKIDKVDYKDGKPAFLLVEALK